LKAIVLHGSPRKNKNSDTLAAYLLNGLCESISFDVRHFFTNEMNIKPCQGCLSCAKVEDKRCVIKDDMQDIYTAFIEADVIVFATPMYWGYITAQLKAVIDRMEALVVWDYFKGKTFIVLITYRYHCESTVAFFERICKYFDVRLHTITCRTLDLETDTDIPISRCQDKLNEAFELGRDLGRISASSRWTAG